MNGMSMTFLLFSHFEKNGQTRRSRPSRMLAVPSFGKREKGGFAFRVRAKQNPRQIPLDPPFPKGESRAAESGAVGSGAAKCCAAKHRDVTSLRECPLFIFPWKNGGEQVAAALREYLLFPPLKKGGRGDLLFVPVHNQTQSKSPFIPLFQKGRAWLSMAWFPTEWARPKWLRRNAP